MKSLVICTHQIIFGFKKSRLKKWAGHVARMVEKRVTYRVLVGKLGGKRPFGKSRRRWEDNIKINLQEGLGTGPVWLRTETGGGHL